MFLFHIQIREKELQGCVRFSKHTLAPPTCSRFRRDYLRSYEQLGVSLKYGSHITKIRWEIWRTIILRPKLNITVSTVELRCGHRK